jgi:hypothetical protein
MVFVKQTLPTRQIGLTHLPNIYMSKTIWQPNPKIPENVKKQLEKFKEEREKRANNTISNHLLHRNMRVYEMGHQVQQLQSARNVNPNLVQHRY